MGKRELMYTHEVNQEMFKKWLKQGSSEFVISFNYEGYTYGAATKTKYPSAVCFTQDLGINPKQFKQLPASKQSAIIRKVYDAVNYLNEGGGAGLYGIPVSRGDLNRCTQMFTKYSQYVHKINPKIRKKASEFDTIMEGMYSLDDDSEFLAEKMYPELRRKNEIYTQLLRALNKGAEIILNSTSESIPGMFGNSYFQYTYAAFSCREVGYDLSYIEYMESCFKLVNAAIAIASETAGLPAGTNPKVALLLTLMTNGDKLSDFIEDVGTPEFSDLVYGDIEGAGYLQETNYEYNGDGIVYGHVIIRNPLDNKFYDVCFEEDLELQGPVMDTLEYKKVTPVEVNKIIYK